MVEMDTGIIKPALLILIPFTWVVGMALKKSLSYEGSGLTSLIRRIIKDTSRIRPALYAVIVLTAIVIGFILSDLTGMRKVGEAVVIYGLHGIVCTWLATRLYDKVREQ